MPLVKVGPDFCTKRRKPRVRFGLSNSFAGLEKDVFLSPSTGRGAFGVDESEWTSSLSASYAVIELL